jgi:hypothetical protein
MMSSRLRSRCCVTIRASLSWPNSSSDPFGVSTTPSVNSATTSPAHSSARASPYLEWAMMPMGSPPFASRTTPVELISRGG